MKFLIVIALLAPALAFGKTVTFTPIAEDIAATSTGSPGKVIINLMNISPDGKKAILKYTESGNMNKKIYKVYEWSYQSGLKKKYYDALSNVIIGEDFTAYKSIDINDNTAESGFTYESNSETITITLQDVPSGYLPNGPEIATNKIIVTSRFGETGVAGMLTGSNNASGRAGFIWTKEDGFINPTYNIPTCYWYNCALNITSGDTKGKGLAGLTSNSNPLYIDMKTGEKKDISKNGYDKSLITKLSQNGEYGIIANQNNPLGSPTMFSIYNIDNNESTFIPSYWKYDWDKGLIPEYVKLTDLSDNGRIAIGYAGSLAIIWTPSTGTRDLAEYITSEYGVDLRGWTLTSANHISPNGQYIYGNGITPGGLKRVWRLELNRICETPDW